MAQAQSASSEKYAASVGDAVEKLGSRNPGFDFNSPPCWRFVFDLPHHRQGFPKPITEVFVYAPTAHEAEAKLRASPGYDQNDWAAKYEPAPPVNGKLLADNNMGRPPEKQ